MTMLFIISLSVVLCYGALAMYCQYTWVRAANYVAYRDASHGWLLCYSMVLAGLCGLVVSVSAIMGLHLSAIIGFGVIAAVVGLADLRRLHTHILR